MLGCRYKTIHPIFIVLKRNKIYLFSQQLSGALAKYQSSKGQGPATFPQVTLWGLNQKGEHMICNSSEIMLRVRNTNHIPKSKFVEFISNCEEILF